MVLNIKEISKIYGINQILENISFLVEDNDRLAVVGVNGAGKSTLFKIITGQETPDGGSIDIASDTKIGYLSQLSSLNDNNTIYEELFSAFSDVLSIEREIKKTEKEMAHLAGHELEVSLKHYGKLQERFENLNGYECESRVRGVINGLSFTSTSDASLIGRLSGGEKTRVSLGKLLLQEPRLLLLDEPTNHLDIKSIEWLEMYLKSYKGSVIIISHDRYFLDRLVNKVVEIENKKATLYIGNYSYYAQKKKIDREVKLKQYIDQQKVIKKQEESIKLLKSFGREKFVKRARSKEKQLDKMDKVNRPEELPNKMHLTLIPKNESGNEVLTVQNLMKNFGERVVFKDVSFNILKGDKVALIGNNGVGKTTLIRAVMNKLDPDGGKIIKGSRVEIGYYDQEHQNICYEKTIFQEVADTYPSFTNGEIRNALAAFMFTGDEVYKPISALSGGEVGRLSLAKIILSNANFLILDEPTNHLDIFSKEILEDAIRAYTGTIFYISHDRYFINNSADKILELSPNGVKTYLGDYNYYLEKKLEEENSKSSSIKDKTSSKQTNNIKKNKDDKSDNNKTDEKRIVKLESEIEKNEDAIKKLEEKLSENEISSNSAELTKIYNEIENLNIHLLELINEWELLCGD